VLSTAYVLKEQLLESIEVRHANERAYQEAVSAWQLATDLVRAGLIRNGASTGLNDWWLSSSSHKYRQNRQIVGVSVVLTRS
jgi:hypothetical protein